MTSLNQIEKIFHKALDLQDKGKFSSALELYEQILQKDSTHYKAIMNMGNIFHALTDYERSISLFNQVISIEPSYAKAYNNLGKVYHDKGEIPKAIFFYQKAISMDSGYANAHFNLSLAYLLEGNFEKGWPLYEYRFHLPDRSSIYPHPLKAARWNGSNFENKTLFVHTEQGIGDTIQFIRYLPYVKARGGRVIFENLSPLSTLLKNMEGVDIQTILLKDRPCSEPYDYYTPLLSLPLIFKSTPEQIPFRSPYISADPKKTVLLKEMFNSSRLKVGLTWAGKPTHHNDLNRSIPLADFLSLFQLEGVDLYGIQKEVPIRDQGSNLSLRFKHHFGAELHEFADTAAIIHHLDLVISVDTATAHLAGAMGKPVLILLPHAPDFRWMLHRTDTPWYPSARLYRQSIPFSWREVMAALESTIRHLVLKNYSLSVSSPPEKETIRAALEHAVDLLNIGNLKDAFFAFEKIADVTPSSPETYFYMGHIMQEKKEHPKALQFYEKALLIDPDFYEALFNQSVIFSAEGRLDLAIKGYERVLFIKPDFLKALNNLGILHHQQKNFEKAISLYQKVIQKNPNDTDAHFNLAKAFLDIKDYEKAEYYFKTVLKFLPESTLSLNALGRICHIKGAYQKAASYYQKALLITPDDPEINFNLSLIELLTGRLKEGWKRYEFRFKKETWRKTYPHRLENRKWEREPLKGKRLLIHAEQGFGDNLHFIRYLSLITKEKKEVLFECPEALTSLFQYTFGKENIIPYSKTERPSSDYYIPLLSLPALFKTRLETIPNTVPYLFCPPSIQKKWEDRFDISRFNIGLIWAGTIADPNRSCPLAFFKPLLKVRGTCFWGLQKGIAAKQLAVEGMAQGIELTNLGALFEDFSDTAGVIHHMDLIITIDTSVAHLAGAMGKKVWLMLPFVPDWRWLLDRTDSPWYPTMRLFRQPAPLNWPAVIEKMTKTLKEERIQKKARPPLEYDQTVIHHQAKNHLLNKAFDKAILLYRTILEKEPFNSDALEGLGVCYLQQKEFRAAVPLIQKAIDHKPNRARYYYHLALCYLNISKERQEGSIHSDQCTLTQLSEKNLLTTIAIDPLFYDAHYNLGILYGTLKSFEKAKAHYEKTIEINPSFIDAHYNLGNLLRRMGALDEAKISYLNALELNENEPKIWNNLGLIYREMGEFDKALTYYDRAIAISEHYAEAHWNRALTYLIKGDLKKGFKGYEWRFYRLRKKKIYPYTFNIPKWKGEDLKGKRLFIHSEQGFGDTIQFSRFLPLLKEKGATLIFEVQKELLPLFHTGSTIHTITPISDDRRKAAGCDYYLPLLSLPYRFSTVTETIPKKIPYIHPSHTSIHKWRQKFTPESFTVGLVWAGKPLHENDHNRSCPFHLFLPFLDIPGIQYLSLQKKEGNPKEIEATKHPNLNDLGENLSNFGDTAAVIAHLDLLISVDTAAAHLGGAMGIPVWLLLPYAPDWRWMTDREDSPWYPTMRLFRQSKPQDWRSVVSMVFKLLKEHKKKLVIKKH